MAQLTPLDFMAKWQLRFQPNTTFEIEEADLQEFATDIADTFGVRVENVPEYLAGTTYAAKFLVRYTPAGGQEAFYYSLQAGVLGTPGPANLLEWKQMPKPPLPAALSQYLTLAQARNMNGDTVVLGRDYAIELPPSASGHAQYLSVAGIAENWFASEGYLVVNNVRTPIENIDYVAGTWRTKGTLNTRYGTILFGTAAGERSRALGFQERVAFNAWALLGNGVIGDFQFHLVKNQTVAVGTYLTTGDLNVAIGSLTAAECAAGYYVLAQYGGTATNVVVNFKALAI